jgi:ribosome maturation protein SDO1
MANVEARIKIKGKQYEILVDLDEALKVREGKGDISSALQSLKIYYDLKKGTIAAKQDLLDAFGTEDVYQIATHIITKGEVQKTQEFRDAKREEKVKQVVSLIVKNAVDQNGRPISEDRIRSAIQEVHFTFDNRSAEQQMADLVHKLKEVMPIRIETKRIRLTVPSQYTGQVYGIISDYKESEDWLANGNLQAILNVPAGLLIDFYDRLNSITHGAAQSEELKQDL